MAMILTTTEELRAEILKALSDFEAEKKRLEVPKVYTINHVAKLLGKSHSTIKKLVRTEVLKTTIDGLILSSSLEDYLRV